MTIVITGGRDRTTTVAELERVRPLLASATVVRQGDARGTDKAVATWLRARNICPVEAFPADWDTHGKAAGPIRNALMLDGEEPAQLDLGATARRGPRVGRALMLVAFEGGRGTANCRAGAAKRGIRVAVVPPVSEPRPWNRHHGDPPGPAVDVGRGSPLGNPWPLEVPPGESRLDAAPAALTKYARWLRDHLADDAVRDALMGITSESYLVCSCWPAHCHAEVVVRAWRHVRGIPKGGYG